ncbi:MAG TPA: hypothetical protein VN625_10135 [Desulfuromonadaceae bacterium]|nr:hypothetical protein [Desulfuromonadaceae bacterium]
MEIVLILFLIGFGVVILLPNFPPHRGNINGIINNLRQIDGAKNEWAYERGFTNTEQFSHLTNQLTEKDLFNYFHHGPGNPTNLVPIMNGEIYTVNAMNRGPEAKLTRKEKLGDDKLPIGTVIRLEEDPISHFPYQIILPDGTTIR